MSWALLYNYRWDDEHEARPGQETAADISDIHPDDVSMSDLEWLIPPKDDDNGGDDADMDDHMDDPSDWEDPIDPDDESMPSPPKGPPPAPPPGGDREQPSTAGPMRTSWDESISDI